MQQLMKLPLFFSLVASTALAAAPASQPTATDYPSIQEAIDAHPGQMIFVPAGDYLIDKKIYIGARNAGLFGPGRIIQSNPDQPIVEIEHAAGAQLRDLTLTRAEGKMDTDCEGILVTDCRDLAIDNVRVIDNRTRAASISIRQSKDCRISHCLVRNYTRISVDDRTAKKELYGFAFRCIDGTGIDVTSSTGTLIEGNRLVEEYLQHTPEIRDKFGLGTFVKKNETKGSLVDQKVWDEEYIDIWHQGSAIHVSSPEVTDQTRILGNHIQNAAQGIDLHCDHVIVAQNLIENAFSGMKAMHGARNVLIIGNQFTRNDLWAVLLAPGAASNATNTDGGSIIAHNIVSDFGHGDANWIWGNERSPFKFDSGQLPDNPPLTDVIFQGNIVQSIAAPRYKYAVVIAGGPDAPRGLHFSNNLLHPGTAGVSNKELQP